MPPESSVARAGAGREYEAHSLEVGGGFPRYHDWLLSQLEAHLRGRVIEVGAGIGTIASRYVDHVDHAFLVEPATNLHAKLAATFAGKKNVQTACGFLQEVVERDKVQRASFDTAVMVNVLEHIEDDREIVRVLFDLLKPGGTLLVFVPALPFLYGSMDERVGHFRRYTRRTLSRVVESAGLRVKTMQYFDLLGMLPWFLSGRVLKQSTVGDGSAKFYDQFVVPICSFVDQVTKPALRRMGKNLICVAEKP